MPRSGAGRLAGPGFVVRGGPEYGSVGLGCGTHAVWVLTVTEHRTSDTVQPDCVNNRPVKQYIVRGPLVTASQTTQNNKPLCTPLCWARALLCHLHVLSETSCFPLMKSWRARCIQIICFYWKNTVIFHWLITINIYMQNICAVFRVICEEWQVGCQRLFLFIQYKIIQM